jgi:hypothetical protein
MEDLVHLMKDEINRLGSQQEVGGQRFRRALDVEVLNFEA